MAASREPGEMLAELSGRIAAWPETAALYMERGRLYNSLGMRPQAMNDFLRALELDPGNVEAAQYLEILRGIFEFRDPDMYNP